MWGIIPAAGLGSRIQPLAFSKELLPVGIRLDGETARPQAVSEYLVERLIIGGATKICFVVSPRKSDIIEYFGGDAYSARICYVMQPEPAGLCDAIFRAVPLIHPDEVVMVGLPDTVWFPEAGFRALSDDVLSFLLFPVERPELFDAVLTDDEERVLEIQVKRPQPDSRWIWGAFKMPGATLHDLFRLWRARGRRDVQVGTLINAYLAEGGVAKGVRAGQSYVDVGTYYGYREAVQMFFDKVAETVST
jgi:glucose-1-phosphate thymidylyltransferase